MVRQRPRKSVEELYATKFETNPNKSQVHPTSNGLKTTRGERPDYGSYMLSTGSPYSGGGFQPNPANSPLVMASGITSSTARTARHKSARVPPMSAKPDKYYGKDDKSLNMDDVKKEHNGSGGKSVKTARVDKTGYNNNNSSSMYNNGNMSNLYDNKNFVNCSEARDKDQTHSHHHHHHPPAQDDDKDDDTEEFFELIRRTVESAIGKSISDLLNRNFRELGAKVDRFSSELKSTNSLLSKLQTEINNKVVHYGEENSRHFRYLCMKSEYDKMFYQHHTMLASKQPPTTPPPVPDKRPNASKPSRSTNECEHGQTGCPCRGSVKSAPADPHKTSSEDHCMSQKSSEMGMREVLEHIQRFCTQMQLNELKNGDGDGLSKGKGAYRLDEAMKINKQVFDEDDDDFQMSSDGMTPRSDEHIHTKYGGTTVRSGNTARNTGGGDA